MKILIKNLCLLLFSLNLSNAHAFNLLIANTSSKKYEDIEIMFRVRDSKELIEHISIHYTDGSIPSPNNSTYYIVNDSTFLRFLNENQIEKLNVSVSVLALPKKGEMLCLFFEDALSVNRLTISNMIVSLILK